MAKRTNQYDMSEYQTHKKIKHLNSQIINVTISDHPQANLSYFIKDNAMVQVLQQKGIKNLFPIQYQTFQHIFKGEDIIARDRTGSGKTLAYALPIIERFRQNKIFHQQKIPKFLIVLPTRQLAIQVTNQIKSLKLKNDFEVVTVYGGSDINQQTRKIKEGCDIIASTPGRLLDLIERNVINLNKLQVICLDEADQMLKQGFQEDIERIFNHIHKHTNKTQNLLFSATIPPFIIELSKKYLSPNYVKVDLIKDSEVKTSKTVQHLCLCCNSHERNQFIGSIIDYYGGKNGRTIIFCQTKREANQLSNKLHLGRSVEVLHGDIPQFKREKTFEKFKNGRIECLVATNVAARGLDFPQIDLIIQLQPPKDIDFYIHRSGRTGRAGKSGKCVTFFSLDQQQLLRKIEKSAKIFFTKIKPPKSQQQYKSNNQQHYNTRECYKSTQIQNKQNKRNRNNELHIFIGSLSPKCAQSDLYNFFNSNQVIVKSIKVLKDDKGQSKCIAFGQCEDQDNFNKAIKLSNQVLETNRIVIKPAKKQN